MTKIARKVPPMLGAWISNRWNHELRSSMRDDLSLWLLVVLPWLTILSEPQTLGAMMDGEGNWLEEEAVLKQRLRTKVLEKLLSEVW